MSAFDRLATALADRYRIERELGTGGMATVYLAHDLKHDRRIALKVLKPELSAVIGAERFLAEIKTTANLQHPHILPLFDSGAVDGTVFYAMPFVAGESLRDRLSREKQLPIPDAVRIATEVASALDYAHRHGVIHRDIKPENILLHDGSALVADFGIALAANRSEGSGRMTETGMSLGSPHYMSPEQAMGERGLDARTDIYALGCMLYEMLAGETPFDGPNTQAIIARVISSDPGPVTTLRRMVPPHVAHAVHTAIQKLPADRFESAARFADALAGNTSVQYIAARVPLRDNRPALVFAGIALLAAAAALWVGFSGRASGPSGEVTRFALALPAGQELAAPGGSRVVFAPDGQSFVYIGPGTQRPMLWHRRLGELDAVPIPNSEGATNPTFSPDGTEIAFLTITPFSLRVVSLADGASRTVLESGLSGGGVAWAPNDDIYVDGGNALVRVRPDGTGYEVVMPLDTAAGEFVAWPHVLPDERGILVRVRHGAQALADYSIVALDLRDNSRKHLVRGLVARYSPTGHLIWAAANGSLHAQRFDLDRLELTGEPVMLWSGVAVGGFGSVDLALSATGDLAYTTGAVSTALAQLVWVSRDGLATRVDSAGSENGIIRSLALSPNGTAAALAMRTATVAANLRIWVKPLGGGAMEVVTTEFANSNNAVWTSDGRDLLYTTAGGEEIRRRRADGTGTADLVLRDSRGIEEFSITMDGRTIVLRSGDGFTGSSDLLQFRVGVDSVAMPLLNSPSREESPAISRDGRWLAYSSDETGRLEVYVRPFPDTDAQRVRVSPDGGAEPRWNGAGDELFFLSAAGDMMSAAVRTAPVFAVSSVNRLFNASGFLFDEVNALYDVSADGQRFLMLDITAPRADEERSRIVLVQNFATELMRRLPR